MPHLFRAEDPNDFLRLIYHVFNTQSCIYWGSLTSIDHGNIKPLRFWWESYPLWYILPTRLAGAIYMSGFPGKLP